MTEQEELDRAAEAEFLLNQGVFKESISSVEQAIINGIKRSAFKDSELREKLCHQLIALDSVVTQLRSFMETGKLVEETIKRRRTSR